jgi:cell division septal protein FtsQ
MDYSKKNLENPFHKHSRGIKRDELSLRLKLSCLGLLIILIGVLYFMFFSTLFNLEKIQINGLARVNAAEVEQLVWEQSNQNRFWLWRQSNLLVFDKNKLSQELMTRYHFKAVQINKSLFHTLKINLSEREYRYLWQEKDKYYYIDAEGFLIDELVVALPAAAVNVVAATTSTTTTAVSSTTSEIEVTEDYFKLTIAAALSASHNSYPIIVNVGPEHFKGDLVDIDQTYLEFTSQLNDKIKANNEPELTVKYFLIDKDFNTIKAILGSGLTVYFSTKEDRDSQIRNLLILKKSDSYKLIKKKIDLRYGDKVYYE